MAQIAKKSPHLSLDGKWFPCLPAGEFGFLGDRIMCDLGTKGDQGPKTLLVRPLNWIQEKETDGTSSSVLEIDKISDVASLGLRSFAIKIYDYAIPSAEGKLKRNQRQFLQQDISGLMTLREAILKVVKEGSPRKVWHLFYSACKALNNYAKSMGGQRMVPLQCPNGLAVDVKTGSVVILDAEVRIPTLSDSNEKVFAKWFGASGRDKYAQENDASLLHSKALLLFFREVLGYLHKKEGAPADGIAKRLGNQLDELAAAKTLQELQDNAEQIAEDWSLAAEEVTVEPVAAVELQSTPANRPPIRQEKKIQTWLGWFLGSFLANILLALLLLLLAGLWLRNNTRSAQGDEKGLPGPDGKKSLAQLDKLPMVDDSSLQFSSYCVVFPARGTSSEKVLTALKQLYPENLLVPKQGESEQTKFLSDHLDAVVNSLKEADQVHKLLRKLNAEHSIRFNGFSADAEDSGLKSIIANGGLYRIASQADKVQHGSLLRANSVERILTIAGMDKQPDPRQLLESLKVATHEYASIKDAVTIIGDRAAFIIRVEPTAKAHEVVRTQLLGRDGTPVFVPRPVFELFDAVDPAAGTGGGIARYSLKLDEKCFWRLVGRDDRVKTDYELNPTNNRMKWQSFNALQEIVWTTLPVLRKNGRTDSVSSFDIAITVSDKVVIFRNQSILTGESKNDVFKQARGYLDSLGFKNVAIEDAPSIRQQDDRFTGALLYPYLAGQAQSSRDDMEISAAQQFENAREREDNNGDGGGKPAKSFKKKG